MAKQKKTWYEKFETLGILGEGGNAKVYHVKCNDDNKEYALKDLVAGGKEKPIRFRNEINIMKDNCGEIDGIIPIVDYSFDENWYTMPICKPIIWDGI
jgi:serine/threonine protein kinase